MILPAPSITVTNDTVTYNSTATLICLSSINNINVSFVYEWIGPANLVISGETDGILIISSVDVDDAGEYMCTSTASYNVIRLYLLMTWIYYELITLCNNYCENEFSIVPHLLKWCMIFPI